jgi:glycosyltransferase involved in cell wall biosynthesis/predicted Zn-dependent protease
MTIRLRCEYSQYRYWGVPTRYIDLVRYLDGARYQPVLHGTSDIESESQLPAWLTPLRGWLGGLIGHGGMPWYRLGDLGAEVEAMQSCKAQQTDIIHFMDGEHCGQFLPRRIREMAMATTKTVATFHQPPDIARGLVNEEMLRWLDAIILVSPSQLPFFKQRVSEDKLHVVLLGVDADLFSPAAEKNDSDRVACITTGLNLRDWETFKKVAQRMPDVTFVVVTSSRLKFEDMPNVTQHSGISDAALADLYRSADILFLPLLDTTANNTLLEGIASGLPVVATDHPAVRAYLPNDEGILIAGNRVDGFVDAVKRLQRDPALRRKMGQQARARAEELSWPNIIKQYDAIYTRLHASPVSSQSSPPDDATMAPAKAPPHNRNWNLQERFRPQSVLAPNSALQDVDILGYALLETGLTEEATWLFEGLSKSAPEEVLGDAGMARIAERQWKWNDAIAAIDKCLLLAPDDIRPRLISIKANYLAQSGDTQRAKELLLSIQKEFAGLLALARLCSLESPEQAHNYWKACVAQFPDQPDGFLGQAAEFIACGKYAEADGVLAHTMGVWPNLLAARVLWARCATNAKDMQAARARWKVVLAAGGRDNNLPAAYARYLGLTRDHARAESYCRSFELSPAAAADFFLEYHSASGDLEMAIQHARELSSLQPDDPAARLRETALYMRQGAAEGLRTAETILRHALAKAPDSVIVKAELAELLIRLGLEEEAKQIVQTINPADKRVQFEILRLWTALSDSNDADGVEYWKSTFLQLGALAATKNFSTDLRLTDRHGFY